MLHVSRFDMFELLHSLLVLHSIDFLSKCDTADEIACGVVCSMIGDIDKMQTPCVFFSFSFPFSSPFSCPRSFSLSLGHFFKGRGCQKDIVPELFVGPVGVCALSSSGLSLLPHDVVPLPASESCSELVHMLSKKEEALAKVVGATVLGALSNSKLGPLFNEMLSTSGSERIFSERGLSEVSGCMAASITEHRAAPLSGGGGASPSLKTCHNGPSVGREELPAATTSLC